MVLRFEHLQELWGNPAAGTAGAGSLVIGAVRTDSRAELVDSLFVPLVGERFDAHQFLPSVLERAAAAIAQRDRIDGAALIALAERHGCPLWLVDDSLQAYQDIARQWRRILGRPVVAVTGSAGKTTTRELIRAALAPLGPVVASSGNENNDIGAPLTVLKADDATAALVVEMGMRGLGEIERLSLCAEPDVAVITNIGTAHIGRLGSREAIATAKCEISAALRPEGLVVIPAGDPLLEAALAASWGGRVLRVALADEAGDFAAGLPQADWVADWSGAMQTGSGTASGTEPLSGTAAAVPCETAGPTSDRWEWLELPGWPRVRLPLAGRHNARNLLLALAVAGELGVSRASLSELVVELPGGRSRRLQLAGVQVLDETYNASPEAMLAALDLLAGAEVAGKRYAVLGTMLELGDQSLELHRRVGERAAAHAAAGRLDGLVIVDEGAEGEAMQQGAGTVLPRLARVARPQEAVEPLGSWLQPGDCLLLKASRGVALEQVLPLLEKRQAPPVKSASG
jgi:UDP-N-acetylmuramoyl-tripeptide--D-alanyl-D-alanine ligase